MSSILKIMCSNTFTTDDLHRRIALLQSCLEEILYHQSAEAEPFNVRGVAYARVIGSESDSKALEQWGSEVWDSFNESNLSSALLALKAESVELKSLILYVPVKFDESATVHLGSWCKANIDADLLLELLIDPNVIGGCALVYDDSYHDLSLRSAFSSHKGVVTELLSSYA